MLLWTWGTCIFLSYGFLCVADQNSAISVRWFLKSFLEEDGGGGEGQRTSVTASYGLGKCDISFSKSNTNGYKDIAFF